MPKADAPRNDFGYDPAAYDKALAELVELVKPSLPSEEERAAIPACQYGTYSDDWVARFLRARASQPDKFHVRKSHDMLLESLKWRREHGADHILERGPPVHPGIVRAHPGGYAGTSKDGCCVYVERLGKTELKTAVPGYVSPEDLVHFKVWTQEELCRRLWHTPRRLATIIVDTDGLSMAHGTTHMIKFMMMQGKVDADNYPEILNRVFVINTVRVVTVLWNMVKGAFDPKVREKIVFCGADYHIALLEHCDATELPDFLNGGARREEGEWAGQLEHLRLTPSHPEHEGLSHKEDVKHPLTFDVEAAAGSSVTWRFLTESKVHVRCMCVDTAGTELAMLDSTEANTSVNGEVEVPKGSTGVTLHWEIVGRSWLPGHRWLRWGVVVRPVGGELESETEDSGLFTAQEWADSPHEPAPTLHPPPPILHTLGSGAAGGPPNSGGTERRSKKQEGSARCCIVS